MNVLMLSGEDVRALLEWDALLKALAQGFRALSQQEIVAPNRGELAVPGQGHLLIKPAWMSGAPMAVKLVSTFLGNPPAGLPAVQALVTLFDQATGSPLAVMDGAYLTAARTSATAALATKLLARSDARKLAIVGAGVQGRAHLDALPRVRDFGEIRVASLLVEEGQELAAADGRCRWCASSREAVEGADVVCLCTSSPEPVIAPGWVAPGAHVTSVGYHPPGGELPVELARSGTLAVETRRAFEPPPVGCGELAGLDPSRAFELGELVARGTPVRKSDAEITVFKSMGHAMEDLVTATWVYRKALERNAGTMVRL
jgi:ornithine cyclodeaminase/thiomorpholine-carboxylate dehydrogenase